MFGRARFILTGEINFVAVVIHRKQACQILLSGLEVGL